MDHPEVKGHVNLAVALVLSLLWMAASPAPAASGERSYYLADNYTGYELKQLQFQSESAPLSGYTTAGAKPAYDHAMRSSNRDLWAQSEGESAAESDSAQSDPDDPTGGMSIKELSQQSANPVSKNAYIVTQFATTFNDGDLNTNDAHVAGNITFQPIIPIPLYGEDENEWRIVTRPTINLFISQPLPDGPRGSGEFEKDNFDRETGLSDLLIPLPLALPDKLSGRWLLALGPSFSIPTNTDDQFGVDQWCAGVTGVFGYIAENWMCGAYRQTYFKIADWNRDNDERGARFGNMFYWFFYNITDDWQIGTNPTIQWNDKAGSGNKWNIPVGLTLSKITKWGNTPMRLEFGAEYSVVNQDDYGEVARFKFNIIPVVSRPIKRSIFGGSK